MSDLDKLMKKLKTEEPKKEEPKPEIDDDEDEEDEVEETTEDVEKSEPIPANVDEEHSIEAEVGILQNNGIFRRELLLIKKEQVDVLKIMAQTLLDIKKKLIGDDDGKKN